MFSMFIENSIFHKLIIKECLLKKNYSMWHKLVILFLLTPALLLNKTEFLMRNYSY